MNTPDYYERYNTSLRTRELINKGYRLLFTPEVIRDLKEFQKQRTTRLSGRGILLLANRFDQAFSPRGDLEHWMEYLVRHEWVTTSVLDRQFNAASSASYGNGGMSGGYNGAYWGITQFSSPTYRWVRNYAAQSGLLLPASRQQTSFEEQLIAAYVLAVLNQSIFRPYVRGELNARMFYLAHNQGAGSFKTKKISKKRFNAQSDNVRRLLREEGFMIA